MKSLGITERINKKALELLEQSPEGMRWSELIRQIKTSDPELHPKTVNGCVWKLVENFPDKVYKPSKGLFRLLKYKTSAGENRTKPTKISIDDYVANVPMAARAMFDELRQLVKGMLPNAQEELSYGIVGYRIDDKRARVFISGWKDHVAVYPIPKNEALKQELGPYIKGKGTLWFSLDTPLPSDIIKEVVRDLSTY